MPDEKIPGPISVDEMARRMGHDGNKGPIEPIEHKPMPEPALVPRQPKREDDADR